MWSSEKELRFCKSVHIVVDSSVSMYVVQTGSKLSSSNSLATAHKTRKRMIKAQACRKKNWLQAQGYGVHLLVLDDKRLTARA